MKGNQLLKREKQIFSLNLHWNLQNEGKAVKDAALYASIFLVNIWQKGLFFSYLFHTYGTAYRKAHRHDVLEKYTNPPLPKAKADKFLPESSAIWHCLIPFHLSIINYIPHWHSRFLKKEGQYVISWYRCDSSAPYHMQCRKVVGLF